MVDIEGASLSNKNVSFLDIAKGFVPKILEASREITEGREIPPNLASEMAEEGLFRLYIPESFGGHEIDYIDFLDLVAVIAEADGSVGWCFNQNNVLGTIASLMPESLAREIWSDSNAILSNGPPQNVRVTTVEGGYVLTGRWNFSSGSQHATWVIAVGKVTPTETLTMMIVINIPKN